MKNNGTASPLWPDRSRRHTRSTIIGAAMPYKEEKKNRRKEEKKGD
jgi:hypothetical protein